MPVDLVLRYSALATLTECQLKFKLQYASGLTTAPGKRLVLGSAFHALMQGHYESFRNSDMRKQPRDLGDARRRGADRLNEYRRGEGREHIDPEMIEQLRWMYMGYVDRWGVDSDFDKFLVIDEKRVVPLLTHRGVRVMLQVTADLIGHHAKFDKWLLLDHKTASQRDAAKEVVAKENQLDAQRALYTACYRHYGPKKGRIPIFGAYHNVIRTDKLKRDMTMEERFARTPVFFNDTELLNIWNETKIIARKAVEIHLGIGDIYSSPNPTECGWKCSAFIQPHLTARATGRDVVEVAISYGAQRQEDWEPLATRLAASRKDKLQLSDRSTPSE